MSRTEKIKRELFMVSRFTVVGIIAAVVHIATVWSLISYFGVAPLLANLIAFLSAFSVSFAGQYFWTFRSDRKWHQALRRFLLVSASAFGINNLVLSALLGAELVAPAVGAVLAAMIIPVFTYLLGRWWAF